MWGLQMLIESHLTPAEEERLTLLQEEASEVIQAVSKIRRFKFDGVSPVNNPKGLTNRQRLTQEVADLAIAIQLIIDSGDIDSEEATKHKLAKTSALKEILQHQ